MGSAIERRRGLGAPLPGGAQAELEAGLEADLSDVRVHTDSTADQLSQSVQAKAFTTGSDIFFRSGQYDPGSESGKKLLAHEATHVRQQRTGPVSGTPTSMGVSVSDPADTFEREAEATAETFVQRMRDNTLMPGEPPPSANGDGGPPSIQRQATSVVQRCVECGRLKCGCADHDVSGPAGPPIQRAADEFVSEIGISEEGLEALANIQRQIDPGGSHQHDLQIQRFLEGEELEAELAIWELADGVDYEVQGQAIVVRRTWLAETQPGVDFTADEIRAPIAIAILLRELKTQGPLSWIDDSLIPAASSDLSLGGPWPETYTWVPFYLALSVRVNLGSPANAPDAEWHRVGDSFTLTVRRRFIDGNTGHLERVGERALAELEQRTGLSVVAANRERIAQAMADAFGRMDADARAYVEPFNDRAMGVIFGADVWEQYIQEHPVEEGAGGGGSSSPPAPQWARDLREAVWALVEQERARPEPPADLPDRITLWYRTDDQQWFMIVSVHFDSQGDDRASSSVRLNQRESVEELFVRIRAAAVTARQDRTSQEGQAAADAAGTIDGQPAPDWAQGLLARLEASLARLREEEPDATDIPSRLALGAGESRPATGGEQPEGSGEGGEAEDEEPVVLLVIQVDIDLDGGDSRTYSGTLGYPLNPTLTPDELIRPIRLATASLRLGEYDPGERPPPSPDQMAPVSPDTIAQLNAYPSVIQAADMPSNFTTITNGEIEFTMQLNYADIHGSRNVNEELAGVSNAMRTVYYEWRLYDVSQIANPSLDGDETQDWASRADWLQQHFVNSDEFKSNPGERIDTATTALSSFTGLDILREPTYQVTREKSFKFPAAASEFLIFCRAIQDRDEDGPQRAPSIAYYPVRTLAGYTLASQPINSVPERIAELRSQLEDESLSEEGRRNREEQLQALETQERSLLPSHTSDRLTEANQMLSNLDRLEEYIREHPERPGDPISLRVPDSLYGLYMMIEAAGVSISAMREQFTTQKSQIEALQGRINIYGDMFKTNSPYQYRPEAALASEKTGQVHPFIFMLGEATDSSDGDWKFHLVDVTAEQTRGVYTGESTTQGTAGIDEAINRAFVAFGEEAKYGEGVIAVRIPQRANPMGHQPNIRRSYQSSPGPWQVVRTWLGYLAAAAGIAAR